MKTWEIEGEKIFELAPLAEYLAILKVGVEHSRSRQRLILAVGDHGVGKTVGARIFCREHSSSPTYLSIPAESLVRARDLLRLISGPLGLGQDFHSRYDFARTIIEDSHRSPRTIIFDGAQALRKYQWLDLLRWIHDEGAHTFVLVGSHSLQQSFLDHPDLGGRVLLKHHVRLPTAKELAPVFPGYPPEAVERVYTETGGHLRQVMALRRWLQNMVDRDKIELESLTAKRVGMVAKHFLVRAA